MSQLPDSSRKPHDPEMWICLLPAMHQLAAEGAGWGGFVVPLLLHGFSEEGHQAQWPAWQAGVKGQEVRAPAQNDSADEPKDTEVSR